MGSPENSNWLHSYITYKRGAPHRHGVRRKKEWINLTRHTPP